MQLQIITPDKNVFDGQVNLVQLPGSEGSFELLDNHAPIIATLGTGAIKVQTGKNEFKYFKISGGVLEAQSNNVIVLVESVN